MEGSRSTTSAARKASEKMRRLMDDAGVECRLIATNLGFPHYHFSFRTVVPPGLPLQIFVDGGPAGFRELYDQFISRGKDPVLRRAMGSVLPFALSGAIDDDDREAKMLMGQLAEQNIEDGLVIPLHGPRASHGMLTLLGGRPIPQPSARLDQMCQQAQWQSMAMFDKAITSIARSHEGNVRRQLTARQRKALALAAGGKVLTEIATELKVHPSTARYLVSRAAEKLGVETRIEAIVRIAALSDFFHGVYPAQMNDSMLYFAFPAVTGSA
jgi:DNA-binding CsgD family transcriptional regulator